MSENKNNEQDLNEKINSFKEESMKAMKETTETVWKRIKIEKRKAEIRSEIGHLSRELSKSYEKLGRQYFLLKENHTEIGGENETFDLIRSKEKLIELLNEKLDQLDVE
jgi:hypothetical protein